EKSKAPASPISITASRWTVRDSCSPGCITRANSRSPSTVSEIQQGPVGCRSSFSGCPAWTGTVLAGAGAVGRPRAGGVTGAGTGGSAWDDFGGAGSGGDDWSGGSGGGCG